MTPARRRLVVALARKLLRECPGCYGHYAPDGCASCGDVVRALAELERDEPDGQDAEP